MTRLTWGESGARLFTTGVDRGVFYPKEGPGVVWNGLVSVQEAPSGEEVTLRYFDGVSYVNHTRGEEFKATIEAFTYPAEFLEYDGFGEQTLAFQRRKTFGFAYRTSSGNDVDSNAGYQLHIVYNALAVPTQKNYATVGDDPSPETLSWDISTLPVRIEKALSTSHLIIDSATAYADPMSRIETILYGSLESDPRLPSPDELVAIFNDAAIFKITDHGDGTFTAEGPDEAVLLLEPTVFQLNWPSVQQVSEDAYRARSL